MFHIIISYFNTYIFFRNVVVIFVFSYHVENLAVVLKNLQAGARAQKNTALPMPWSYQTEHPKHLSQL